jgi:hypothetical protein
LHPLPCVAFYAVHSVHWYLWPRNAQQLSKYNEGSWHLWALVAPGASKVATKLQMWQPRHVPLAGLEEQNYWTQNGSTVHINPRPSPFPHTHVFLAFYPNTGVVNYPYSDSVWSTNHFGGQPSQSGNVGGT